MSYVVFNYRGLFYQDKVHLKTEQVKEMQSHFFLLSQAPKSKKKHSKQTLQRSKMIEICLSKE